MPGTYNEIMQNDTFSLEGYELFDNSAMARVVDKITITKSYQMNFPAAFYSINALQGKQGVRLYFNKASKKVAIQFVDEAEARGFKLVLSSNGKYGAYISAKSFLMLNKIEIPKYAGRYDYQKLSTPEGEQLFVIDLTKREEGGDV